MTLRRTLLLVLPVSAFCLAVAPSVSAAPPVVPACTPKASTGSDSCVRGTFTAVAPPLGGTLEPIRLGTRVRSVFSPSTHETTQVVVRFDDNGTINLAGIPTCPASMLVGKDVAAAWAACGPGAGTAHNAYLSTGLGANVSGIASTVPPGNFIACTMIFKGADNNHLTLYARAPVASTTTGCNNPATNTAGTTTVLFTGSLTHQPAASPYDLTLTVPNTQAANPALDDFYATIVRGATVRANCPAGASPLKVQATFTYTPSTGDPPDTISPPYPGTQQTCP